MPTNVYKCGACGTAWEAVQPTLCEIDNCPKCRQANKKRFAPATGFVLTGTGFHNTDYKKKEKTEETHP